MQALTLITGLSAACLIQVLRPLYGLGIYLVVLFLYPSYLRVPVFGLNVSAQRMVIAALLIRILMDGKLVSKFKLNLVDKLVVAMFVIGFVSLSVTMGFGDFAKTYSGSFMDTVLVYFAFRLTLTDKRSIMAMIKVVSVVLCIAGVVGIAQSLTGKSVYSELYLHCPWNTNAGAIPVSERIGLFRANGPFGVHIMFGLSFVAFIPLILLLKHEKGIWEKLAFLLFAVAVLGILSSVSAGPYLGVATVFVCLFFKRRPQYVKPALTALVLMVIACQIISNRGFFYAMSRFAFNEGNAWYRARLMDVAVMKLPEYWPFGYGMVEPGWGDLIDNREHTDICNQYVLQTVYYGLGGLAIFICVLWASIAGLRRFRRLTKDKWSQDAGWLIASALVALIVAFLSVGVFGKFTEIFHSLLGVAGCFYIARPTAYNTLLSSYLAEAVHR